MATKPLAINQTPISLDFHFSKKTKKFNQQNSWE